VQPERFGLEYTDSDGQKKRPVMIHKALLGTIDRFLGVYIEHTAGAFPPWLAPEQVRVLPVSEGQAGYAGEVLAALKAAGVRATIADGDSLGKRIRAAKQEKLPYVLVVGDKEAEANAVSVESRDQGPEGAVPLADFVARVVEEIADRR